MTAESSLLPLFPLQAVLFPGARLHLKVFETRYLDLITRSLREGTPFGVVRLLQGSEVQAGGATSAKFETIGVLAHVEEVDAEQAGILQVRCRGGRRFTLESPVQRPDGLWQARSTTWPGERQAPVPDELASTRDALKRAINALAAQQQQPFSQPYRFDNAGWIANRWCELLPIPQSAKQRLMALDEPVLRLKLVDEYLRSKGVMQP